MSLPSLMRETEGYGFFRILDRVTREDGVGGYYSTYAIGAKFEGVLVLDDSIDAQEAMAQGITGVYTMTYDKALRLPWHTVFCKDDDRNEVFRVVSRDEKSTPSGSRLDLRIVKCEEWSLPNE